MKTNCRFALKLQGLSSIVLGFFMLCSCDEYDPSGEEVVKRTAFAKNFEETFGEIPANQTWDLTKTMPRTKKYDLTSMPGATRATHAGEEFEYATEQETKELFSQPKDITSGVSNSTNWNNTGWYVVEDETLDWMKKHLVEKQNNTDQGSPFTLVVPGNKFAIIPIYQGHANTIWDLHLVDVKTKKDYKLWSKGSGFWIRESNNTWTHTIANTMSATKVVSRPLIIDNSKISGEFFLYLDITQGANAVTTGTAQRSDEGMMLSLKCPIPNNLKNFTNVEGSLVMIIGCESANLETDWDYNDLVLLVVGYPEIPDLIEHHYKRYMCEDLGNTYDFDFNDIVVDVEQTCYLKAHLAEDGTIVREEDMDKREQIASITHLCGTLPFQVTIGDYTFPWVSDPTNHDTTLDELTRADIGWEPSIAPKTITGWNEDENNISIKVADKSSAAVLTDAFGTKVIEENNDEHIYRIDFPEPGNAPLIIAVDPTLDWMPEHQHIPASWWRDGQFHH